MKRTRVVVLFSCCLLVPGSSTRGAETGGYRVPLFDSASLEGWQVTGCEAFVRDGNIFLKSGNGLVRTNHRYTDFVLDLEWTALKPDNWDSGIYFRCELPLKGRPWPPRYQANLRKGLEGNVDELNGARSRGLIRPGEWRTHPA